MTVAHGSVFIHIERKHLQASLQLDSAARCRDSVEITNNEVVQVPIENRDHPIGELR